MSLFICPLCGGALERNEKSYICPLGHSYDVSAEGYVHLLPANKKHSKLPGDDKNMVRARSRFLSGGFYQPLHAEHLHDMLPQVVDYLALPSGAKFILDREGYEDVWLEE